MKRLDIRAAHLTPNQRCSMLALKLQDQRLRRARWCERLAGLALWTAAALLFWRFVVQP